MPGDAEAYCALGTVCGLKNDFSAAVSWYDRALAVNNKFGRAYLQRGLVKLKLQERQSACEDLQAAALLNVPEAGERVRRYCR